MKNIVNKIIIKRRSLVFDEVDIARVLRAVSDCTSTPIFDMIPVDMTIRQCRYVNHPFKWIVEFNATNETWNRLVDKLDVVRVFKYTAIPKNYTGLVYTTD